MCWFWRITEAWKIKLWIAGICVSNNNKKITFLCLITVTLRITSNSFNFHAFWMENLFSPLYTLWCVCFIKIIPGWIITSFSDGTEGLSQLLYGVILFISAQAQESQTHLTSHSSLYLHSHLRVPLPFTCWLLSLCPSSWAFAGLQVSNTIRHYAIINSSEWNCPWYSSQFIV